ncbi:hypothetical protein FW774_02295 (plasmid) [Pedobacter sp. BS3]|nr:hypothetical protein FW774_02295 [Pedobacter sp. BS3]
MNTTRNIVLLLVSMLLVNCGKDNPELPFMKSETIYDLAVEGGINTYQRTQYIRLTKPALHPDSLPKPVSNADVKVNDGKNNIAFHETATRGVYSAVVNNNTNYNKVYTLTIRYNNREYLATDTLRQVININDDYLPLSAIKMASGNVSGIIPKHTFGYLYSSKWLIAYRGIPAWNPAKFDEANYYSYTHSLGSPNSLYPLTNQSRKFELKADEFITIYKFSMTERYARYLYALFQETEWKGIFSGVPAKINGNISGNAQGYFYVTDVDVRRYRTSELIR